MNDTPTVLRPYRIHVDDNGVLHDTPSGRPLGATVEVSRGRVRVKRLDGRLLYSCPTPEGLAHFAETYWYRTKEHNA